MSTPSSTTASLAERVRRLLRDRDWSQVQLAEASGVDPTVLSRLLRGDRSWRREHVAGIAAAFSMTPAQLVEGTDEPISGDGGAVDASFVEALTRDHGSLLADKKRLEDELDAVRQQAATVAEDLGKLTRENEELRLALEREKRARVAAESAQREADLRQAEVVRDLGVAKADLAAARIEMDTVRRRLDAVERAHAHAVAAANRNYGIAKQLQQQLASAKGVAAVAGIVGLAMLVGSSTEDVEAPARRRRRRR